MAKSKTRRKKAKKTGSVESRGAGFRWKYAFYAAAVAAAVGAGYGFVLNQNKVDEFAVLAVQGRESLTRVATQRNEGRGHAGSGERMVYSANPPTSGRHYPTWVDPGFYETAKGRSNLVHSLEHGMIVIFYDDPGAAVMETLQDWTALFPGTWSGIVSVARAGLGEKLVLTAWRRTLRLDRFEAPAAAAFIDAYRGRGPEHPVR